MIYLVWYEGIDVALNLVGIFADRFEANNFIDAYCEFEVNEHLRSLNKKGLVSYQLAHSFIFVDERQFGRQ
jgi:hypothetical protein